MIRNHTVPAVPPLRTSGSFAFDQKVHTCHPETLKLKYQLRFLHAHSPQTYAELEENLGCSLNQGSLHFDILDGLMRLRDTLSRSFQADFANYKALRQKLTGQMAEARNAKDIYRHNQLKKHCETKQTFRQLLLAFIQNPTAISIQKSDLIMKFKKFIRNRAQNTHYQKVLFTFIKNAKVDSAVKATFQNSFQAFTTNPTPSNDQKDDLEHAFSRFIQLVDIGSIQDVERGTEPATESKADGTVIIIDGNAGFTPGFEMLYEKLVFSLYKFKGALFTSSEINSLNECMSFIGRYRELDPRMDSFWSHSPIYSSSAFFDFILYPTEKYFTELKHQAQREAVALSNELKLCMRQYAALNPDKGERVRRQFFKYLKGNTESPETDPTLLGITTTLWNFRVLLQSKFAEKRTDPEFQVLKDNRFYFQKPIQLAFLNPDVFMTTVQRYCMPVLESHMHDNSKMCQSWLQELSTKAPRIFAQVERNLEISLNKGELDFPILDALMRLQTRLHNDGARKSIAVLKALRNVVTNTSPDQYEHYEALVLTLNEEPERLGKYIPFICDFWLLNTQCQPLYRKFHSGYETVHPITDTSVDVQHIIRCILRNPKQFNQTLSTYHRHYRQVLMQRQKQEEQRTELRRRAAMQADAIAKTELREIQRGSALIDEQHQVPDPDLALRLINFKVETLKKGLKELWGSFWNFLQAPDNRELYELITILLESAGAPFDLLIGDIHSISQMERKLQKWYQHAAKVDKPEEIGPLVNAFCNGTFDPEVLSQTKRGFEHQNEADNLELITVLLEFRDMSEKKEPSLHYSFLGFILEPNKQYPALTTALSTSKSCNTTPYEKAISRFFQLPPDDQASIQALFQPGQPSNDLLNSLYDLSASQLDKSNGFLPQYSQLQAGSEETVAAPKSYQPRFE